jgi:MFS family permease
LRAHRVLHACSYLAMYALSPALPGLLGRFHLTPVWASTLASTWLLARVLTFALLERWHGWHGRWAVAWIGIALVLCGFGTTVLAPYLGPGLPVLTLGLLAFGGGLAALYTAALYYAFEVGGNEGGSSHEALIGLGYSLGPLCGLATCGLARAGALAPEQRAGALLVLIAAVCSGGALWAWSQRRSRHRAAATAGAAEPALPPRAHREV